MGVHLFFAVKNTGSKCRNILANLRVYICMMILKKGRTFFLNKRKYSVEKIRCAKFVKSPLILENAGTFMKHCTRIWHPIPYQPATFFNSG